MEKNWIGIIGNVGPEADEILQKYIRLEMQQRGALNDQDYLPMFVIKNPDISDRTAAIFHGKTSPAYGIVETCKIFEKNKVFYAALPSNTSHYFFDDFQSMTDVYIINLIDITARYISDNDYKNVGILCTTPTKNTKIYCNAFEKYNINAVYPCDHTQEICVQNAIYGTPNGDNHHDRQPDGLKSGNRDIAFHKISKALTELVDKSQCQTILMGCTEIPTIMDLLQGHFPDIQFIDPMKILAQRVIEIKEAVDKAMLLEIPALRDIHLQNIRTTEDIAHYVARKIKI